MDKSTNYNFGRGFKVKSCWESQDWQTRERTVDVILDNEEAGDNVSASFRLTCSSAEYLIERLQKAVKNLKENALKEAKEAFEKLSSQSE